jgi:PAS domain-containing protein
MEQEKELTRIKVLLKANPRGLTITDISKRITLNRNSVARYMDVLTISGQAEMRPLGPAKVYYLSSRIPISAMVNFSSDYILAIDDTRKVIQISDNLLHLMNAEREAIIGQSIEAFPHPLFTSPEMQARVTDVLDGKEVTLETKFQGADRERYAHVRMLPTTFEDGSHGVTWLLQDITERKRLHDDLMKANWALKERVKELMFLYTSIKEMQQATSWNDLGPKLVELLILVNNHAIGRVSVYYTEDRPFIIPQEESMLNALAENLSLWLASHRD